MKYSEIHKTSDENYFQQNLIVKESGLHTWDYCQGICGINDTILHIGCSDYPFKEGSMHCYFLKLFKNVIGYDIKGIEKMRELCPGTYFNLIDEMIDINFDVVLIPNVVEHIPNPGSFVDEVFKLKFKKLFCIVPTFFISSQTKLEGSNFTEMVHPDHVCWYSPYTLLNLFSKQIKKHNDDCELIFFDNKSMVAIEINL